jgi:hypothetical protein
MILILQRFIERIYTYDVKKILNTRQHVWRSPKMILWMTIYSYYYDYPRDLGDCRIFIVGRIILMRLILQVVQLIGIFRSDISLSLTKIKLTIHQVLFQGSEFDSPPYDLCSNDFHREYLSYILRTTILQYILQNIHKNSF